MYTAVTHFFDTNTYYEEKPATKVQFICKISNCVLKCKLGELTNLNSHLLKHEMGRKW